MTRTKLAVLAVASAIALYAGFQLFWFLTDDAYIAFRYVSNRQLGFGYVWNPPPFLPVEGYTSFLWVVLLDAVWTITGVAPPSSANWVSFAFGAATLALVARVVSRMPLPARLEPQRFGLLVLVVLGIVTNRTFLAWLSSGLETALFNFAILSWIFLAVAFDDSSRPPQPTGLALAAAAAALTRPDGYLAVAGTLAIVLGRAVRSQEDGNSARWAAIVRAWPVALVALHVFWRRLFYGEWLPNTYYAKYTAPWPQSGWRYALSFVLEYGLVVWIGLALFALVRRPARPTIVRAVVWAVVAGHLVYYTLLVGGDHFEYRVYSHLVPLVFVSFVALCGRLDLRPRTALASTALFVVASWPIPWVHWAATRQLDTRLETLHLVRPVAQYFPPGLRRWVTGFDGLQRWLIERSVCMRQQEHKTFQRHLTRYLPSREEGASISWNRPNGRPVLIASNVGVVAWVLPHVAVIDTLGLNDWVIARTPAPPWMRRQMAHDRRPPAGYDRCFRPNLLLALSRFQPPAILLRDELRERPLTDPEIIACERRFREQNAAGTESDAEH